MILSDNETKLDLLNNQAIAKTIVSIIKDSKESVSIGVHGDWGAGKSSILAMVEDLLNPKRSEDDMEADDSLDDELDLAEWDEEDPENAANEELELPATGYVTVRFNSWQYQGFEDAKIALMSAIVKALQKEAKSFYKQHPVKGAIKKVKTICKNIWKNLDKLSLAKSVGKVGVSLATGTSPIVLLDIATKYASDIFTDETKRNDFISTAGALLKSTAPESSNFKEMAEFRANYIELFTASHIDKLVVLIDDLDRCLPKVAIETLEAVRLFLAMKNTAFIIAADDEMIKYSVKEYFPRVIETEGEETLSAIDYNHFSDKYLEKLIQIPLHIPRIGIAEAQLYVLMLLIESQIGESDELKALASTVIKKLNKPWALEQLTPEEIKDILGESYDSAVDKIKIAKNIDQFLAEHTGGNPRNIKRFVNMLLLRAEVAHNRGFEESDLEMAVLAKMMLVEQYNYSFYKAIAEELREDGTCPAFDAIPEPEELSEKPEVGTKLVDASAEDSDKEKKGKSRKPPTKEEAKMNTPKFKNEKFGQMIGQEDIKAWIESEPSLAGKDLRPYFFACTQQEDFFFSTQDDRMREIISAVRQGKFTTSSRATQIKALEAADAMFAFQRITTEVFKRDLNVQKTPPIVDGLRVYVTFRNELQAALADFLLTLPADKLGVWATGGWDDSIPKSSEARSKLNTFIQKIKEQTTDPLVRSAAESALR